MPTHDGISIPEVWGLSDDDSHVIVRVFVSEKDLPSSFDRRRKRSKTLQRQQLRWLRRSLTLEYN